MTIFVRVVVPVLLIAFAATYYMEAGTIEVRFADGPVGPPDFPKVLAVALVAAVAVVVVTEWRSGGNAAPRVAMRDLGVVALVLSAAAIYVAVFAAAGFAVSTLLLSAALLAIFSRGAMGAPAILLQALAITAAVYLLFAVVFDVRLPPPPFLDAVRPSAGAPQ